jgi:hypothetical protein
MNARPLVIVGAAVLSSVALASAKTYEITLPSTAKAVALKHGEHKIKVEGSQAVFTNAHNKSVTVPARVENADKRFGDPRLETVNREGDGYHPGDRSRGFQYPC